MNWDQIGGKWKQFKGRAKEKWGKLTDDELDMIDGRRELLVGKLQEKYGYDRGRAEREVEEWQRNLRGDATAEEPRVMHESRAKIYTLYKTSTLIGHSVKNATGEDLGRIEELVTDIEEGHIVYAVLSFGGFLGVGNKLFAIPWPALMLKPYERVFVLNVEKERLQDAPGFSRDNWPDMANPQWGSGIYEYYGYSPFLKKTETTRGELDRKEDELRAKSQNREAVEKTDTPREKYIGA